jgi:hypothetical protein
MVDWPTPNPDSGFIPDVFDERDHPYKYLSHRWPVDTRVNLWEEHPTWLQQIYHQYGAGSCTANATAAAVRYLSYKMNYNGLVKDPSRLFIYYNARALKTGTIVLALVFLRQQLIPVNTYKIFSRCFIASR